MRSAPIDWVQKVEDIDMGFVRNLSLEFVMDSGAKGSFVRVYYIK